MAVIVRLGCSLAIAVGLLASGPALAPRPASSWLGAVAQAADSVRKSADPCFWEMMAWTDMNPAEQKLWGALGWNQDLWEGDPDYYPPSETAQWSGLSDAEKAAASKLGFDEESWNAHQQASCD